MQSGGGLTYHFVQNPGSKLTAPEIFYVLAHTVHDNTDGTNTTELYKSGSSTKDYKCVVTGSTTNSDSSSQQEVTDEDCKVYSVESSDDSSISLKDPESTKEIKTKSQITNSESSTQKAALYQISLKKETLDKFKNSDLTIKLVPKSETYSSSDSKTYITFKSYVSFGKSGVESTKGQARNVVVQIISDQHNCKPEHKDFKLGSKGGYKFFKLANEGSTSVTQESDIHSKHFAGLNGGSWAKCSELTKDKFYLLNAPEASPFDIGQYRQEMEFSCDDCEQKIKTRVVGFLVSRTAGSTTRQEAK